jgi:hypothetical protein
MGVLCQQTNKTEKIKCFLFPRNDLFFVKLYKNIDIGENAFKYFRNCDVASQGQLIFIKLGHFLVTELFSYVTK